MFCSLKNIKKKILLTFIGTVTVCLTAGAADFNPLDKLGKPEAYFEPDAVKLLQMASTGDTNKTRSLMIEGTSINSKGPKTTNLNVQQISILSYALAKHDLIAVRTLIQVGANPLYRPSSRRGNTFLFAVMRHDIEMLDTLYKEWPVSKIPAEEQQIQTFSALLADCQECLQIMLNNGLDPNLKDERGYNLFMEALSNEQWNEAWWLLSKIKVTITAQSTGGITPANAVQYNLFRFKDTAVIYDQLMNMKNYMEKNYSVRFPVETSIQIKKKMGL